MKFPLDSKTARRVAVAADCDDRTVQKHAAGLPVRGHVATRIAAALQAEGISLPAAPQTRPAK